MDVRVLILAGKSSYQSSTQESVNKHMFLEQSRVCVDVSSILW